MDSFRPGSVSYCPFAEKENQNNNNVAPANTAATSTADIAAGPAEVTGPEVTPEEETRRRLYLNLGRPRPFYRVSPREERSEAGCGTGRRSARPVPSLQELARGRVVGVAGLERLAGDGRAELAASLPPLLTQFLLTLPCRDFQEEEGSQRPASAASYRVRCKLDGRSYVALFATSEVDQTSHNVWTEEAAWLERIPGIQQILALAVDAVTENIFFLLPDGERPLSELLGEESGPSRTDWGQNRLETASLVGDTVLAAVKELDRRGLPVPPVNSDTVLVRAGRVFLQNGLLCRAGRGDALAALVGLGRTMATILCPGWTDPTKIGSGSAAAVQQARRLIAAPQTFLQSK